MEDDKMNGIRKIPGDIHPDDYCRDYLILGDGLPEEETMPARSLEAPGRFYWLYVPSLRKEG